LAQFPVFLIGIKLVWGKCNLYWCMC